MDAYAVVKFLHVLFVIVWLGGGFALVVLATNADRTRNDAQLTQIVQNVIFMSSRVFIPAALLALICGLILVYLNWSFGDLWVVIGLAGYALTFVTGVAVVKPRADRLEAAIKAEGGTPSVAGQGRQLLSIAQFDFVMLFIVVADMVLKPAPRNYVTLVIMAAVLVVGAVVFLGRLRDARG